MCDELDRERLEGNESMEDAGESLQDIMDRLGRRIQERTREEAEAQEEAPSENTPQYRDPPAKDGQPDFFVPMLTEVSPKDDMNLLDVSPYGLSKTARTGEKAFIQYKLKDAEITIEGGVKTGMATIFDYDVVLHMISHLSVEAEKWRKDGARDEDKPPRQYRVSTYDILKFCCRGIGTRQYKEIEDVIDRVTSTKIKIVKTDKASKRRDAEWFSLVDGVKIVSKTDTGKVSTLDIGIPHWIYNGVVTKKPTLLALDPQYFLITRPLARFLYRLARKAAGNTDAHYTMRQLYERSGSMREFKKFSYDIRKIIDASQETPLPEYDFSYERNRNNTVVHMVRRQDTKLLQAAPGE